MFLEKGRSYRVVGGCLVYNKSVTEISLKGRSSSNFINNSPEVSQ